MTTYTESHSHIDHSWNTDGWIGWDMTQSEGSGPMMAEIEEE